MIKGIIEKIISKNNLDIQEAEDVMLHIMEGNVNESHLSALLIALKCKGETHEEVAGFTRGMRKKGLKINTNGYNYIDVCGTGGDHSGTFNISTATAFVVAAAGVGVAKHGNRSISSLSGSADVLRELGVPVHLTPEQSAQALETIGITFLFAPDYHPAMKHVAPVRKNLAMKTVFNILGPLTNPANTKRQLIGTFNDDTASLMANAAKLLDMERVCFICTDNRYDEILLNKDTRVFEYTGNGAVKTYIVNHETFGYPEVTLEEIKGDSPERNADIIRQLFTGRKKDAAFYVVVANAALALYTSGFSERMETCRIAAEEAVISGAAGEKLESLIAFGNHIQ